LRISFFLNFFIIKRYTIQFYEWNPFETESKQRIPAGPQENLLIQGIPSIWKEAFFLILLNTGNRSNFKQEIALQINWNQKSPNHKLGLKNKDKDPEVYYGQK